MKITPFTAAIVIIGSSVDAESLRGKNGGRELKQRRMQAIADSPLVVKKEECTGSNIISKLGFTPDETEGEIDALCASATPPDNTGNNTIPFGEITKRGYQFDKNFFDGGTSWNDGLSDTPKSIDAGRIPFVADAVSKNLVEWPTYIPNFDDSASCELRTAVCCFVHEQASGVTSPMAENTANADVCYHDMEQSQRASHTRAGISFFSDGQNTDTQLNDAYCTGFSWSANEDDVSTKYRTNTLFNMAMLDNYYTKNYAGGVPGAPMCACVEQMPIVTKASCTKPVESAEITVEDGALSVSWTLSYENCNDENDLLSYYSEIATPDEVEALSKKLVGDEKCSQAVDEVLTAVTHKRGEAWWYADREQWVPIAGKNRMYHPSMDAALFREAYDASSTKIIRRVCRSCKGTHKDIYYSRITPIPANVDLVEYLKNSWTDVENAMGVDFNLYSTYEAAAASDTDAAWKHCEYSAEHGFPYDCGPYGSADRQWNSFERSGTYANDFAFYIER